MAWVAVVLFALILILIGIAAYGVSLYNGLVSVKHQVDQAWSNIDVLLRQRHDELPKLIDSVKGYVAHERELLQQVTSLRSRAGTSLPDAQRLAAEDELSRGVARLLAVAESYPQLRASEVFVDLQRRIAALEEQIAHRREYYNAAVNINNVRMEQFPDMLLAALAGLQRRPLFEATEQEKADVDVGARLRS
ncbi:MAG TPA: LemA family protein [Burkholderiales bacterium]|nr:LemA family protein [Betaproteobacteria bacterium]HQR52694.1 LemA family protein [Burkholderiales bacterium]